MNIAHVLLTAVVTIAVSGCAVYSKQHFFMDSFGLDLNDYVELDTSVYTDGLLEVHDISSESDIYQEFFGGKYAITKSTDAMFRAGFRQYNAQENSPLWYVIVAEPDDGFGKYVLYFPEKNMMVFIYADAVDY